MEPHGTREEPVRIAIGAVIRWLAFLWGMGDDAGRLWMLHMRAGPVSDEVLWNRAEESCDHLRGTPNGSGVVSHCTGNVAALEEANRRAAYPIGCSFAAIFESIGRTAVDPECSQLLSGDGRDEIFCTPPYLAAETPFGS